MKLNYKQYSLYSSYDNLHLGVDPNYGFPLLGLLASALLPTYLCYISYLSK